jgi:hypothetical protein
VVWKLVGSCCEHREAVDSRGASLPHGPQLASPTASIRHCISHTASRGAGLEPRESGGSWTERPLQGHVSDQFVSALRRGPGETYSEWSDKLPEGEAGDLEVGRDQLVLLA